MDSTVIIWNLNNAGGAVSLNSPSAATSVTWSPDGQLASGSFDGSIIIWDLETGQPAKTLKGHTDYVRSMAWSPNSKLASASVIQHQDSLLKDGQLIIWDPDTGQAVQILTTPSIISSLAWSPNGRLASGGDDGSVIIWNLEAGRPAKTLKASASVNSVAWSALGKLVSGSSDGSVIIWNLDTDQPEQILKGHKGSVISVVWSPNGQLASGSKDDANGSYGTVIIWNFSTGEPARTLKAPAGVTGVAWSSSGKLASASGETVADSVSLAGTSGLADSEVTIWNLDTGQPGQTLKGHSSKINGIAWSPDGQLASASWDLRIKIARKDLLNNDVCKIIFRNMNLEEWLSTEGTVYTYQPACPNLYDPSIDIASNEIFQQSFSELEKMGFPRIIAKAITYVLASTLIPVVFWLDPTAIDISINPVDLLLLTWKGRIILLVTYVVLLTFLFFIFRAFIKGATRVWRKVRKPTAGLASQIESALPDQQQI